MPSSSPYRGNDYRAISTLRPYSLPVNDIFKAISSQDAFWKAGAQKVKAQYEGALDLDLTIKENKEIRDEFLKEADKQLTKLSAMDLSKGDVQRQGLNIFKPLFQDEGIMYDDAATKGIKKLRSDIMRAKTVDGGKGYSDSNAAVAMDGVFEFQNATDRMAGKEFLARNKGYTPYYDSSKEFMDIVKNCKGPSVSSTAPGTGGDMYLHTKEITGANSERLSGCLEATLSPRARTQIEIDGKAAYLSGDRVNNPDGRNYGALRDDFMMSSASTLRSLDQNVKDMDGKIAAFQASYEATKNPDFLQMKKAAEANRDNFLGRAKNLNDTIANLGDGNFLKNNYDQLAGQLHMGKRIARFAESYQTYSENEKYSADAVKMQAQNLAFQQRKIEHEDTQEMKMAAIEHQYKLEELATSALNKKKTGKTALAYDENGNEILRPTNDPWRESNVSTDGYTEFDKERTATIAANDANNEELFNKLKEAHPILNKYTPQTFFQPGENGISVADSYMDALGKTADAGPAIAAWAAKSSLLSNKMTLLKTQAEINEAEIAKRGAGDEGRLSKTTANIDGKTYSALDIKKAIAGNNPNLKAVKSSYTTAGGDTVDAMEFVDGAGNIVASQKTGKNWATPWSTQEYRDARGNVTLPKGEISIKGLVLQAQKTGEEERKVRNELYGNSLMTMKPTVFADANNLDDDDPVRNRVASSLNVTEVKNVKILKKDPTTGDAWFSIKSTKDNKLTQESVSDAMKSLGYDVDTDEGVKVVNDNQVFVKVNGISNLVDQRTLDNPYTTLQLSLEKVAQAAMTSGTTYGSKRPGETILQIPFVVDATEGAPDFNIKVKKTSGGVEYVLESKARKDEKDSAGNITQKRGTYNPTGQVFQNTNQLLSYLNNVRNAR